jgi:sugar lactone lactonase YvrE
MPKFIPMKKILFFSALFSAAIVHGQQHQLVKLWETDSVFKVPESVLFDRGRNVLYVSNIEGNGPWDKDGKGSIGKLGTDGKVIAAEWITGFNAPKGMAMHNGKLYVADLSELVVIDIEKSAVEKRIAVAGALGLNDVTADPAGVIYVSDSRTKKVFRVENGNATEYATGLQGPNGVLYYDNKLYVLDAGGMFTVNTDRSLSGIAEAMDGGTDGIEHIGGNSFIVSSWAGKIWYVNSDGTKELLLDTSKEKKNTADIGIDAENKIIYVPTFWKNTVVAYAVKDR